MKKEKIKKGGEFEDVKYLRHEDLLKVNSQKIDYSGYDISLVKKEIASVGGKDMEMIVDFLEVCTINELSLIHI